MYTHSSDYCGNLATIITFFDVLITQVCVTTHYSFYGVYMYNKQIVDNDNYDN